MLLATFGVSERRACRVIGQPRSTQRKPPPQPGDKVLVIRAELRAISKAHSRYGYRRAAVELKKKGWAVNTKAVQRLWREEGLRCIQRPKKRRRGMSTDPEGKRRRASTPNEVWAGDFQFDSTTDGRQLKFLNIVDEHTREALSMRVGRSCDADDVVTELEKLTARRGAPQYLRFDSGPEFIAAAVRDWCRFSGAGTIFIEPGAPWENPYVESFNARVRYEHLNVEILDTLFEATVLTEDRRIEYNENRPHSPLGWLSPADYARRCMAQDRPELSLRVDH